MKRLIGHLEKMFAELGYGGGGGHDWVYRGRAYAMSMGGCT
jgi:hypothetical protein